MCNHIGVALAPAKTVGPDTVLQFAGILNTRFHTLWGPPTWRQASEMSLDVTQFLHASNSYPKRTSILNRFSEFHVHCCRAWLRFSRRLIDLTKGIQKPHHHIRLSKGAKLDILLWLRFLDEFNGKSFFFSDVWETSDTLHLYTNAAGSIGFGAVFGCHWLQGLWPEMWKTFNIAFLELFPIVIAVHVWGSLMADKRIIFFSDNAAVVYIINKQTSKHQDIMVLLRDLVLSCLRHWAATRLALSLLSCFYFYLIFSLFPVGADHLRSL